MSITNNTPIKITKKSRLVEIKKVIEDFKQSFFDQFGIKIYTIAVGKDGMVPYGTDFFGRPQMVESYLD